MEEDHPKLKLAYFRYSIIAPLLTVEDGATLKQRMQDQAARIWILPDGDMCQFAWGTIEKWLYQYRNGGIPMLTDQLRKDAGKFPGIDEKTAQTISNMLKDHPLIKTSLIIKELKNRNLIIDNSPSLATIYRYMKTVQRPEEKKNNDIHAFEAPYANYLWQTDVKYGPFIPRKQTNGKYRKTQTYLIAIIDDHSRLLCHGQFFFTQDVAAYLYTLKKATEKRGIGQKLYCDNGKIFHAHQIKRIAAVLGIHVIHAKPYYPAGKGKIERFFRTVDDGFIDTLKLDHAKDIDELNRRFQNWSETDYNQKIHRAIRSTPYKRWSDGAHRIKPLPVNDEKLFHFEVSRRVAKDATFSLNSVRYETSQALIGEKVTIAYDIFDPLMVFVRFQNRDFGRANQLDKNENCTRKRGTRS